MTKEVFSGLFAIAAAAVAYLISYNLWATGTVLILALLIAINLFPYFGHYLQKKERPDPDTISVLLSRGFENGIPEGRIMYVLIITQDTVLNPEDPQDKAILEDIFAQSAAALTETQEFFKNRYADVQAKEYPLKISVGTCTEKRNSLGRCYRDWKRTVRLDGNFIGKENIDLFFHDLQITDKEGITRNAVTAVMFYKWNQI